MEPASIFAAGRFIERPDSTDPAVRPPEEQQEKGYTRGNPATYVAGCWKEKAWPLGVSRSKWLR